MGLELIHVSKRFPEECGMWWYEMLTDEPTGLWEIWTEYYINDFQAFIKDRYLDKFMWNCI